MRRHDSRSRSILMPVEWVRLKLDLATFDDAR